jgi:hypothetical protein
LKYLLFPLTLLLFVGVLNILATAQTLNYSNFNQTLTYNQTGVNSYSNATIALSRSFSLSVTSGLIVAITVAITVATAAGMGILGSGLNSTAIMIAFKGGLLMLIWAFCSALGIGLLLQIQVIGFVIYLTLTTIYFLGVLQQIGFGSA